jgi:hypothetical protein
VRVGESAKQEILKAYRKKVLKVLSESPLKVTGKHNPVWSKWDGTVKTVSESGGKML